jgi:hypothetical protein
MNIRETPESISSWEKVAANFPGKTPDDCYQMGLSRASLSRYPASEVQVGENLDHQIRSFEHFVMAICKGSNKSLHKIKHGSSGETIAKAATKGGSQGQAR